MIVCTDHGHYLGEKDIFGKPGVPLYETARPHPAVGRVAGRRAGRRRRADDDVDLHATLFDLFGVHAGAPHPRRSLVPLVTGEPTSVRDWALAGVWGREVHVIDGHTKYARAPVGDNAPLSMWSNRWSTMPVHACPTLRLPRPDDRAWLDRMPGSTCP